MLIRSLLGTNEENHTGFWDHVSRGMNKLVAKWCSHSTQGGGIRPLGGGPVQLPVLPRALGMRSLVSVTSHSSLHWNLLPKINASSEQYIRCTTKTKTLTVVTLVSLSDISLTLAVLIKKRKTERSEGRKE